jgi:hypothetical protein
MFIPVWLIVVTFVILAWAIWLNFNRAKQVLSLKYSFITVADLAINKLHEAISERENREGDSELVPLQIIEAAKEIEDTVNHLLMTQEQAGVTPYQLKEGAKVLGI